MKIFTFFDQFCIKTNDLFEASEFTDPELSYGSALKVQDTGL